MIAEADKQRKGEMDLIILPYNLKQGKQTEPQTYSSSLNLWNRMSNIKLEGRSVK